MSGHSSFKRTLSLNFPLSFLQDMIIWQTICISVHKARNLRRETITYSQSNVYRSMSAERAAGAHPSEKVKRLGVDVHARWEEKGILRSEKHVGTQKMSVLCFSYIPPSPATYTEHHTNFPEHALLTLYHSKLLSIHPSWHHTVSITPSWHNDTQATSSVLN